MKGAYKFRKLRIGNREPGTRSLFLIWKYFTDVSKLQIGNKAPVPGSFLTISEFDLFLIFVYCVSSCKACNDRKSSRYMPEDNEYY